MFVASRLCLCWGRTGYALIHTVHANTHAHMLNQILEAFVPEDGPYIN